MYVRRLTCVRHVPVCCPVRSAGAVDEHADPEGKDADDDTPPLIAEEHKGPDEDNHGEINVEEPHDPEVSTHTRA
jgi:hypothetical protein